MSIVGIPSVIQTITPSPLISLNASAASIIAFAAKRGGT